MAVDNISKLKFVLYFFLIERTGVDELIFRKNVLGMNGENNCNKASFSQL